LTGPVAALCERMTAHHNVSIWPVYLVRPRSSWSQVLGVPKTLSSQVARRDK
jgi:hypothetical protein